MAGALRLKQFCHNQHALSSWGHKAFDTRSTQKECLKSDEKCPRRAFGLPGICVLDVSGRPTHSRCTRSLVALFQKTRLPSHGATQPTEHLGARQFNTPLSVVREGCGSCLSPFGWSLASLLRTVSHHSPAALSTAVPTGALSRLGTLDCRLNQICVPSKCQWMLHNR
jgi:hypothetical protein